MTMQVVHATRFGGPEVLIAGEAPEPFAGPGQVVVAVSVAEVLFIDTQLRGGWGGEYFTMAPPYVPGTGVAGTVIGVGDGVDHDLLGRQVIARTGNSGGYARARWRWPRRCSRCRTDSTLGWRWRRCTTV